MLANSVCIHSDNSLPVTVTMSTSYSSLQNGCCKCVNRLMAHMTHLWTFTSLLAINFAKILENGVTSKSRYENESSSAVALSLRQQLWAPSSIPYHWSLHMFLHAWLKLNLQQLKLQLQINQSAPICTHQQLTVSDSFSPHLLLPLWVMFRGWPLMQMWKRNYQWRC